MVECTFQGLSSGQANAGDTCHDKYQSWLLDGGDPLVHHASGDHVTKDNLDHAQRADVGSRPEAADVPCGPVNKLGDTFSDPQAQHNRMVEKLQHPKAGTISVPGVVVKMSATPGRISAPPPMLGQHTDEVLAGLGYSATEIAAMRGAHVI
jgi:crotonobetainyl-CoA:carnitine CoA-transferase CaiB-like acyl-CoA transferase